MNVDQKHAEKGKTFTVYVHGRGYVLGFDATYSHLGQTVVRSNYKFDAERAVFLSERLAKEIVSDLPDAVIRPMAVVPSEIPN